MFAPTLTNNQVCLSDILLPTLPFAHLRQHTIFFLTIKVAGQSLRQSSTSGRRPTTRTAAEKESMSGALGEGMLQQLVELLGQVPRIILLILKTNDLSE